MDFLHEKPNKYKLDCVNSNSDLQRLRWRLESVLKEMRMINFSWVDPKNCVNHSRKVNELFYAFFRGGHKQKICSRQIFFGASEISRSRGKILFSP